MKTKIQIKQLHNHGFTLIELMVVIVILGILASFIAPRFMDKPDEAKITKTKIDITSLETALKFYKLDNGTYPDTGQGLQALIEAPDSGNLPPKYREGGYLEKKKMPKDPWKNEFVYIFPGAHGDFDIISYGADGQPGGDGIYADINSWEIE